MGDNAYLLGAELRWSPLEDEPDKLQLVAFLDHGGVGLRQLQPGDLAAGSHLTGAGVGFRWALAPRTNLRFDLGFPLTARPGRSVGDPAVYVGLQTKF